MRRTIVLAAAATALLQAGCNETTQPGIAYEGIGSGTLLVVAQAVGTDGDEGGFTTDFIVQLNDAQYRPVSGAEVSIETPTAVIVLTEGVDTPGFYTATSNGYIAGTYTLSAVRGTDFVSGARVPAPDVHSIWFPAAGDTMPANQVCNVRWSRQTVAEEARVENRNYETAGIEADDGLSSIPSTENPPRTDQRIRVTRKNRILLGGAQPGSRFEASIRTSVEPIVVQ